jgi:hypothetical protein
VNINFPSSNLDCKRLTLSIRKMARVLTTENAALFVSSHGANRALVRFSLTSMQDKHTMFSILGTIIDPRNKPDRGLWQRHNSSPKNKLLVNTAMVRAIAKHSYAPPQ